MKQKSVVAIMAVWVVLFLLAILFALFSCNNHTDKTKPVKPIVDSFGMKYFDTTAVNEEMLSAKGKPVRPVKDPVGPLPQPKPAACVLLVFNGCTIVNTNWNVNGPIVCDSSGLTTDQQQEILDSVAARYSPFNIRITTDESVYLAAPYNRRIKCVFTKTWQFFGAAGGTAFLGSMFFGNETPAFVFSSLLNYKTRDNGNDATHEIFHAIGGGHQHQYDSVCNQTGEYNYGNATFGYIMGMPYQRDVRWTVAACSPFQNDTLLIRNALK